MPSSSSSARRSPYLPRADGADTKVPRVGRLAEGVPPAPGGSGGWPRPTLADKLVTVRESRASDGVQGGGTRSDQDRRPEKTITCIVG